jgi:tetratricopeptide (TPR) repeat protein
VRVAFLSANFLFTFSLIAQVSSADFIANGDQLAHSFDHNGALQSYLKAHAADTSNCTAIWKIAEAYINVGEESDHITQRQCYYMAEKWALKAVAQCPDTANSHFFVAVTSGLLALHEGGKQKVERSKIVKTEAEKTLQINPEHHGALHVLGRWHRELANLSWVLKAAAKIIYGGVPPGASNEAAVESFKKAIDLSPDWANHHKELGLTYMEMEQWQLAEAEFKIALELPIKDHQDEFHKRECRKLLEQVRKKH